MGSGFVEEEITFKSQDDLLLKGTLSLPQLSGEKVPGILILPGSGPANRDGNLPNKGIHMNIYKEMAQVFAEDGFASFRYDKRGAGQSEGNILITGLSDLVNDAEAGLEILNNHPAIDKNKVLVLGHSEGCTVATALNERTKIDGILFIAGAGEPLRDALARQRRIAFNELSQEKGLKGFILKLLNIEKKGEKKAEKLFERMLNTDKDVIRADFIVKMPAKYFREMFSYDVNAGLQKISCPVFAVTGSKDSQADPAILASLPDRIKSDVETKIIENMNHFLKLQETPMTILHAKKELKNAKKLPLAPDLKAALIEWLTRYYR